MYGGKSNISGDLIVNSTLCGYGILKQRSSHFQPCYLIWDKKENKIEIRFRGMSYHDMCVLGNEYSEIRGYK